MIKETIIIKNLKASEGMVLTDGKNFGKMVSLPQGDEGEKWYEITEEEYQRILEETERKEMP